MPSARPERSWAPPAAGGGGAATCRLARRSAGLAGRRALTIVNPLVRRQRSVSLPGRQSPAEPLLLWLGRRMHTACPSRAAPPSVRRPLAIGGRQARCRAPSSRSSRCLHLARASQRSIARIGLCSGISIVGSGSRCRWACSHRRSLHRPSLEAPDGPVLPQRPWPTVSRRIDTAHSRCPHLSLAAAAAAGAAACSRRRTDAPIPHAPACCRPAGHAWHAPGGRLLLQPGGPGGAHGHPSHHGAVCGGGRPATAGPAARRGVAGHAEPHAAAAAANLPAAPAGADGADGSWPRTQPRRRHDHSGAGC